MSEIKGRWKRVANREKWAARGASFVGKAKATKAVWFPPKPVATGKKAASTAKKQTARATKKTTGTAKRAATAKRVPGAAKKKTDGAKSVANRSRRGKSTSGARSG